MNSYLTPPHPPQGLATPSPHTEHPDPAITDICNYDMMLIR